MDKYNGAQEDVVKQIEQADELQIDGCICAVVRRYNALHPEREGMFLSLPTNPQTRNDELENIFKFIRSCYEKQDAQ